MKGIVIALVVFTGLIVLMALRLIERPVFGAERPFTPHITQTVCRLVLRIFGIACRVEGEFSPDADAMVANHSSWLDIFALNAATRLYFVSKSEVARWPFIGWLARATGTVFINRSVTEAAHQRRLFAQRLADRHKLLFFPEGTSTDGLRVLPFKSSLFAALFDQDIKTRAQIQPISVLYHAPPSGDARFYGWWGDMEFGPHFLKILAAPRQGSVTLICHPAVAVRDFADRKALAAHCEAQVRAAMPLDQSAEA